MMNVKILVSYHDEHKLLKSDILLPIQTGCANAPRLFEGMLRDDTGENISADNDRYCELSAQYWAWKNYEELGNPDYIGFMHYRRHFMFDGWAGNPDWCWLPKGNVYFVPYITEKYMEHFSREHIERQLACCDAIVLSPYDVLNLPNGVRTLREQFAKLPKQKIEIFDTFIKTAKQLHPDYLSSIEQIENGSVQYLCNMFVMKKKMFMEYNEFCFPILKALDDAVDSSEMDEIALRFLGYIGEFCLSIFIFEQLKRQKYRVKETNGTYILSDDIENSKSCEQAAVDCLRKEFINVHFPNINYQNKILYVLTHKAHFGVQLLRFAIMKYITKGRTREKYCRKYDKVKRLLRDAKKYSQQLAQV